MSIPTDVEQLADLFRRLGAPDPKSWAQSQIQEGINQLHRFLFLRQAWSAVISELDDTWIDAHISASAADPDDSYAGVGHALSRMIAKGVSRADITDLVRGMQALVLHRFCYLLEDPSIEEEELADLGWSLVETDADLEPTGAVIGGLHESVLEMDPGGRQMRPRATSR